MAARKPTPTDSDRDGRREWRSVARRGNGQFGKGARPPVRGPGRMPPRRK